MGLILWIDQNTFATGLLEKVFKKKGLPFYTIASAQDFVYLVDDIQPHVIVLDTKTALADLDKVREQFQRSDKLKALPVILIDGTSDLNFLSNIQGQIQRPFDPFQVPDLLKTLLKANLS